MVIRFILFTLQMEEEYKSLVEELNELSTNFEKNKERMVEIAKILLTDHYWYLPRKNKQWKTVKGAEKKLAEDDPKNTA